ncbi:MAG: hypothetical protein ACI376_02580, partial [Candidatus Bruticola sp.]
MAPGGQRPVGPGANAPRQPMAPSGQRPVGPGANVPRQPMAPSGSEGAWSQEEYRNGAAALSSSVPRPPQSGAPGPFSRRLNPGSDHNEGENWR